MLILGIESSCDETAASVVEDCTALRSSVIASQAMEHRQYGGVVPELASRRHCENIYAVVQQALTEANVTIEELDGIAVTHTPGLIGALLVGVNFAKGLAFAAGKPLIPGHHITGHIAANYLAHPDLKPPYLCLVVSGGHTMLCEVKSYTEFAILHLLASNRKKIYSLDHIYTSIWNDNAVGNDAIMVHIKNIRKKLGDNSRNPTYIKTAWGKGYYID